MDVAFEAMEGNAVSFCHVIEHLVPLCQPQKVQTGVILNGKFNRWISDDGDGTWVSTDPTSTSLAVRSS